MELEGNVLCLSQVLGFVSAFDEHHRLPACLLLQIVLRL